MTAHAQRPMLDRDAFHSALRTAAPAGVTASPKLRKTILPVFKNMLEHARAQIRRQFEHDHDAARVLCMHAQMMDDLLSELFRFSCSVFFPDKTPALAFIALGGYGRSELFPHSDIDLLFLHTNGEDAATKSLIELIYYVLWDAGLKPGQAQRSVQEVLEIARTDMVTRTALLDARLIVGSEQLFAEFETRLQREIMEPSLLEFVEAKLSERDTRHQRFGDSRFMLEPNVKEGKGGLRDLHTLYWLAKAAYDVRDVGELVTLGKLTQDEYKLYLEAQDYLWHVRVRLHYLAGRPDERLTFDRQQEIARAMGYRGKSGNQAVERFMKHYFRIAQSVGNLTRLVCAVLEEEKKRKSHSPATVITGDIALPEGIVLDGARLSFAEEKVPPLRMLKLFQAAQTTGLDMHPRALRAIAQAAPRLGSGFRDDRAANALFLEILLHPQAADTLRRMRDAELLGAFIPEFGRAIGQMQFDLYHIYTVDEHTLVALGLLHAIEQGKLQDIFPLATDIIHRVTHRRALFVAVLCHDIGKGRGGDQCTLGEQLTLKLARRFGLEEAEATLAAWLVRHHLLCSLTAMHRDLNEPKTIEDFVTVVQSVERLRLLLCITVADIRAVGPNVWNAWKGALLRDLYARAESLMTTGKLASTDHAARHDELVAAMGGNRSATEAYLALCPSHYLHYLEPREHEHILRLREDLYDEEKLLKLDIRHLETQSVTELTVVTRDRHALFSLLAGAIALSGGTITGAQIFTLKDSTAVDFFQVQNLQHKPMDDPAQLKRLKQNLDGALAGTLDIAKQLSLHAPKWKRAQDHFQVPGQVTFDHEASTTHTVIEVTGKDRPGLLWALTQAISAQGLSISSAHINTYGAQIVDVFYVKDAFGLKLTHEAKLGQVAEELRKALISA